MLYDGTCHSDGTKYAPTSMCTDEWVPLARSMICVCMFRVSMLCTWPHGDRMCVSWTYPLVHVFFKPRLVPADVRFSEIEDAALLLINALMRGSALRALAFERINLAHRLYPISCVNVPNAQTSGKLWLRYMYICVYMLVLCL